MNNKNLNLNSKAILNTIRHDLVKVQKYVVVIFVVIVLGLYGFLVLQIGQLSQKEPSDTMILEELGTVKRLKIDETSIEKITQLQDQNIVVKSLFDEARDNPFVE